MFAGVLPPQLLLLGTLVGVVSGVGDGPAVQPGAGGAANPTNATADGGNSTGSGGGGGRAQLSPVERAKNNEFYIYLEVAFGSLVAAVLVYYIVLNILRYVRQITSLHNPTQRYFAIPNDAFARLKQHVLYAPIVHKRHNRELRLSTAINCGTLPTRFQAIFLTVYVAVNLLLCLVSIDWNGERKRALVQLRHRTGVLALANMLPLFVMAGRNNPLIAWLGISFDTFSLMHRWFGRVVVVESVVHTGAYMTSKIESCERPSRLSSRAQRADFCVLAGWAGFKQTMSSDLILGGSIVRSGPLSAAYERSPMLCREPLRSSRSSSSRPRSSDMPSTRPFYTPTSPSSSWPSSGSGCISRSSRRCLSWSAS